MTPKALCVNGLVIAVIAGGAVAARADVITLRQGLDGYVGTRDTSIMAESGELTAGGDDKFFVGRTQGRMGTLSRRALLEFDLDAVPPGATITRVSLTLRLMGFGTGETADTIELHALSRDWGEGTVPGPLGGARGGMAMTGDATWSHSFLDRTMWDTPGGDFAETVSTSLTVEPASGFKTFPSTPELVADVQRWVNKPCTNFGWILIGDESTPGSIKLWASKEILDQGPAFDSSPPTLEIEFEPGTVALPFDFDGDDDVDLADFLELMACFSGSGVAHAPGCESGDADCDGDVDLADTIAFQDALTPAR